MLFLHQLNNYNMKQIIKTHQEGLDILDKIDYNERLLKQSIKFEHQCLGRAWPLPDSHFDNKDEIESEIKKLKSHYSIILSCLILLNKQP